MALRAGVSRLTGPNQTLLSFDFTGVLGFTPSLELQPLLRTFTIERDTCVLEYRIDKDFGK